MKQISVAYGPNGQPTLRWAADLARSAHVPLEVVNVYQPSYAEVSPEQLDALIVEREDELERISSHLDGVDVDVVVRPGDEPLREFARYLDEVPGGLGVIGAHGTHRFGGLGFGRPSYDLLHHTSQPIAMIHPEYEPLVHGTVVVGVDGSGYNAAALEWAESFTEAIQGTLHAVFAYDAMDDTFTRDEGWHVHSDDVRREVGKVASVPIHLSMEPGHPADVLIQHALRERAAAVITGTRGHGGFEGLVLGRVPSQLIAHCTTPLIVVPH